MQLFCIYALTHFWFFCTLLFTDNIPYFLRLFFKFCQFIGQWYFMNETAISHYAKKMYNNKELSIYIYKKLYKIRNIICTKLLTPFWTEVKKIFILSINLSCYIYQGQKKLLPNYLELSNLARNKKKKISPAKFFSTFVTLVLHSP